MDRDRSDVSALLGLHGFVVRAQLLEETTGEWWLAVETTDGRAWCAACGVRPPVTVADGRWFGICRLRALRADGWAAGSY